MPEISALFVYPIKSLAGISVTKIEVEARGLQYDRRWMMVESDGSFITQRDDPSLLRFRVEFVEGGLKVSAPENGSCFIPFAPTGDEIDVRVWNSELKAQIVATAVDAWFCAALGRPCHLVAMSANSERFINPDFGPSPVSFADAMPMLVLSEASLEDLNGRLESSVPPDRFRANVLLRGTSPYQEDSSSTIRSETVELSATKRCGRCLVVCTDQITGERGTEPLRTLAGFRLYNNNACMGMYYTPKSLGELHVGQPVTLR
jgi:uncharacterized protein YcbX